MPVLGADALLPIRQLPEGRPVAAVVDLEHPDAGAVVDVRELSTTFFEAFGQLLSECPMRQQTPLLRDRYN